MKSVDGNVTVRLWDLDLGIATHVPAAEEGQPHQIGKLAAGWYRVEVHHAATGWIDAGRFWLDGNTDGELGRVLMPAPARVTVELDPGVLWGQDLQAFEICSLRRDVDVRLAGASPLDTLLLPSGDYVCAWRWDNGAVHFDRFTAIAGTQITVRPSR